MFTMQRCFIDYFHIFIIRIRLLVTSLSWNLVVHRSKKGFVLALTDSLNLKWFLCMWKRTCWEIDFSVQIILCKLVSEWEQIKHFHLQIGLLLNCTKWTFSSLIYTIGFCHFLLLRLTLWNSCGSKIFNKSIWNKLYVFNFVSGIRRQSRLLHNDALTNSEINLKQTITFLDKNDSLLQRGGKR